MESIPGTEESQGKRLRLGEVFHKKQPGGQGPGSQSMCQGVRRKKTGKGSRTLNATGDCIFDPGGEREPQVLTERE